MAKFIKASAEIEVAPVTGMEALKAIEKIGRTCYKSEDLITDDSCVAFVKGIMKRGHLSVIEHLGFSVRFIVDRGVTHEIVRHRLCSFSQESTRYCNYTKGKFDGEVTFIEPVFWSDPKEGLNHLKRSVWEKAMLQAEDLYRGLVAEGASAQEARSVLPNSLKTEIVMTANLREWRHFFTMRTSKAAHPQMREVTIPLLAKVKELFPVFFDDIEAE